MVTVRSISIALDCPPSNAWTPSRFPQCCLETCCWSQSEHRVSYMKFVPNYPAITFLKRCLAPTEKLAKMQQISLQKTYTKPKIILSDWYYCVFLIDLRPPKAKVTRSHRVWCATKFNDLEVAWRLEKARLLLAIVRAGLEAMRQSLCFTRLGAYGPVMRLPAGALSPCRKPAARMHAYRSCHCRFSPTASNQT